MAAYAATITLDSTRAERISRNLGILTGSCNITNYNTTLAALTDITGKFTSVKQVLCDTVSTSGYHVRWISASSSFKAYVQTTGVEVASDTAIGTFGFIAIGVV